MKFTITLVAIAAQFAGLAAAVPADTAATECGDRGVMQWSASDFQGKPDVDLNDIRKCKEPFAPGATHQAPGVSKVRRTDDVLLEKRDCWYGKEVGCDKGKDGGKGRCWKKCGDGPWCWTARNRKQPFFRFFLSGLAITKG